MSVRAVISTSRLLAAALSVVFFSGGVRATDPHENCGSYEHLVGLLVGKPHFERQVLVLQDQFPGQGHRFELFQSKPINDRRSYTFLRIARESGRACIATAGYVERTWLDDRGRRHDVLQDENDPDVFELVTCSGYYVMTRGFRDTALCEQMRKLYGTATFVVSFGVITADRRSETHPGIK